MCFVVLCVLGELGGKETDNLKLHLLLHSLSDSSAKLQKPLHIKQTKSTRIVCNSSAQLVIIISTLLLLILQLQ